MTKASRQELALVLLGTTLLSFSALSFPALSFPVQGQEDYRNTDYIDYIEVWEIVEPEGEVEAEISDEPALNSDDADSIDTGRCEIVFRHFDEIIQPMPGSVYPWSGKGFAFAALGRYYESIAAFNEIRKEKPINADAQHAEVPDLQELGGGDGSEAYVALAGEGIFDTQAGAVYLQLP